MRRREWNGSAGRTCTEWNDRQRALFHIPIRCVRCVILCAGNHRAHAVLLPRGALQQLLACRHRRRPLPLDLAERARNSARCRIHLSIHMSRCVRLQMLPAMLSKKARKSLHQQRSLPPVTQTRAGAWPRECRQRQPFCTLCSCRRARCTPLRRRAARERLQAYFIDESITVDGRSADKKKRSENGRRLSASCFSMRRPPSPYRDRAGGIRQRSHIATAHESDLHHINPAQRVFITGGFVELVRYILPTFGKSFVPSGGRAGIDRRTPYFVRSVETRRMASSNRSSVVHVASAARPPIPIYGSTGPSLSFQEAGLEYCVPEASVVAGASFASFLPADSAVVQLYIIAVISSICNVGVLIFHWTTPPHPKFLLLTSRNVLQPRWLRAVRTTQRSASQMERPYSR